MKKLISLILAITLVLSLVSCVKKVGETTDTTDTLVEDEGTKKPDDTADTDTDPSPDTDTGAESDKDETTAPPLNTGAPDVQPPLYEGSTSTVSYPVEYLGDTFTGFPSLSAVDYTVPDPFNTRGLSTERIPFSYGVASGGQPHHITVSNQEIFDGYGTNGLAWDNKTTDEKVLYLTFDCGYKLDDLTSRILDTLNEKNVPAAFFCTMDYLEEDPEEIARMIEEGHIVGNHSVTHPDCTTVTREKLAWELLGVHNYMRVNFGYTPSYFRFPTGAFSEDVLDLVYHTGYRSIFWSVAYADWDPNNQIGEELAFNQVTSRLHPGAVILLHSTSPDNVAILGRIIDYAISQGYVFKTLDDYEYWN